MKNKVALAKKETKAVTEKQATVYQLIKDRHALYANVLPNRADAHRFIQACLTALKMSPRLQQCRQDSLLKAIMESARFGLEPNTPLSEAALVPYGDKVEFVIEYRGMLKMAWNSGLVTSLDYDKVCENDEFIYTKGDSARFVHKPNLKEDRGKPYAYYAYALIKGGGRAITVMSRDEIMNVGKRFSRSFKFKDSPWKTDFDAMAIKTVIRQLVDKKLPKSTRKDATTLHAAAQYEEQPEEVQEAKWGEESMEVKELPQEIAPGVTEGEYMEHLKEISARIHLESGTDAKVKATLFNITGSEEPSNDIGFNKKKDVISKLYGLLM